MESCSFPLLIFVLPQLMCVPCYEAKGGGAKTGINEAFFFLKTWQYSYLDLSLRVVLDQVL